MLVITSTRDKASLFIVGDLETLMFGLFIKVVLPQSPDIIIITRITFWFWMIKKNG